MADIFVYKNAIKPNYSPKWGNFGRVGNFVGIFANFSGNSGENFLATLLGVGTKRATTHSHAASNVRDVHTVHVQQDHHCRTTGNPSILFPVAFSRSRIKIDFGIGIME